MNSAENGGHLGPLGPDDPRDVAGYRLLARIGEGGMGSVYLSRTRGNQPVALKVIRREYAQDEEFRRRFEQEATSARRVQGYHIVPVVDHDTTGPQPWLATVYVPGLALDRVLALHGPLPLPAVLQLTGCAAEALHAVHKAGVIHRDLKPSNILVGSDGPWIIDFGIARAADATQLTRSGGLIGTPQFMSPEHANGQEQTPAADIFSLGLIAAVAATGRHPYGDAGAITLATKIANTEFRPPDLTSYPEPLRAVLERTLAADPAARPAPSNWPPCARSWPSGRCGTPPAGCRWPSRRTSLARSNSRVSRGHGRVERISRVPLPRPTRLRVRATPQERRARRPCRPAAGPAVPCRPTPLRRADIRPPTHRGPTSRRSTPRPARRSLTPARRPRSRPGHRPPPRHRPAAGPRWRSAPRRWPWWS